MSVLNISFAVIKDHAAFEEYVRQAADIMGDFDVEVVARGTFVGTQCGDQMPSHVSAVFRYPSLEAAREFFDSQAYLALVPLRDRACDMTIRFYEESAV